MTRRAISCSVLVVAAFLRTGEPCWAQSVADRAPAPASESGSWELLPRFRFQMGLASILSDDPRFSWDADLGGDVDLVQYPRGRFAIVVNYEAGLGKEFQAFDPLQGNYTLAGALSRFMKRGELALIFHHVSRHLGDRPKPFSIDWNLLGARWLPNGIDLGPDRRLRLEGRAMFGGVINRSFVDYTWQLAWGATLRRPITRRLSSFGSADFTVVGTSDPVLKRGALTGIQLDGGVRVSGRAGAVELFASVERRIDADPLERKPRSWLLLGFRLVGP